MKSIFDPFDPIGQLPSNHGDFSLTPSDEDAEVPRDLLDEPPVRPLTWPLRIVLVIGIAVLIGRLVTLQVVNGNSNRVLAEGRVVRLLELVGEVRAG